MGTDIHAVFQAKKDGRWFDIPHKWEENRHYFLFAWLAGVRNGFGFAGVPTHDPIEPIAAPRGLPSDFEIVGHMQHPTDAANFDPRRAEWASEYTDGYDMGDHNHSWLSADEILDPAKRPKRVHRTGVVSRDWFDAWDGKTPPKSWSGGISGRDVIVDTPTTLSPATTHVQIEWDDEDGLDYFVDEVRRLRDEFGDVRMVFGFDS